VSNVTTVGIDLAKNVFSVHGVDSRGKVLVRRTIGRGKLLSLIAQLPPCVIGLEACSGAHEWARQFRQLGHDARLMAPKFVTPYRKSGKNDGNDAEAICEAAIGGSSERIGIPQHPCDQARWKNRTGHRRKFRHRTCDREAVCA
jgi:transposase